MLLLSSLERLTPFDEYARSMSNVGISASVLLPLRIVMRFIQKVGWPLLLGGFFGGVLVAARFLKDAHGARLASIA